MEFLLFDSFPKKTYVKSTNLLFLCLSLHRINKWWIY